MAGALRINGLTLTATVAADGDTLPLDNAGFVTTKKITAANLIGSRVLAGNTLVVDEVNGSVTDGASGSLTLSYSTPELAEADAASGDIIDVYPGSFTLTDSIGTNGVNVNLAAGVTLSAVSDGATNLAVFSDSGSARTFRVQGAGSLACSGTAAIAANQSACIEVSNANSVVRVEAASLSQSCSDTDQDTYTVYAKAGDIQVEADSISSTTGNTVWWENGHLVVTCSTLSIASGAAAFYANVSSSPTGDAYVNADTVTFTSGIGIYITSSQAESKTWVNAANIIGDGQPVFIQGSAKTYVTVQKLGGMTSALANAGVVDCRGGNLWLNVQKITGTYESGINVTSGTVRITAQQLEDLGHLTQGIKVTGGTLVLEGVEMVLAVGNGLSISGGTCRLKRCRIDTTAVAAGNPIVKSGGVLVLEQCVLIAAGAQNCITAGNSQTVVNYGSVANTAKHANVTVSVEAILVDAAVV